MHSIVDQLEMDRPLFHTDINGSPISWHSSAYPFPILDCIMGQAF